MIDSRKQVVFVNRFFAPDESATSRMLSDLSFRLVEHGLRVTVVTSRQLYEDAGASLPPRQTIRGVEVHRVATATRGRSRLTGRALDYLSFHATAGWQLLRLLRKDDVVVAKTDPPLISVSASRAAQARGAVLVNWLQDLFPEVAVALAPETMPPWLQRTLLASRDVSLRRAAMNVVLGERMQARLLARGVSHAAVRVVPNWADTAEVAPMPTESSLTRRRLGLTGRFVVGYSGNLGRAHEFQTLLGAARLLKGDPDFAFLFTGGGAKIGALRQAVADEQLTSFIFQDYQPAELLCDSLAAADVHWVSLLPSLEGLIVPSKLYGILAAGRPTVHIGDVRGDVAGTINGQGCGITIAVGDSDRLAAQLRAMRDDSDSCSAMGARARELALSRYTSERAAEEWLRVLRAVMSHERHRVHLDFADSGFEEQDR